MQDCQGLTCSSDGLQDTLLFWKGLRTRQFVGVSFPEPLKPPHASIALNGKYVAVDDDNLKLLDITM